MSLSRCCRLFGVTRQSIYQAEARHSKRRAELSQILPLVQTIRRRMPRLGTRKLYYLLCEEFRRRAVKLGRDGLFDYLRAENLLIKPRRSYTRTTNSKHWLKKHPNLLTGRVVTGAEQVFVCDITYLKSREATHYLSLVTDAYSRKIMGYKLGSDLSAEMSLEALQMAVKERLSQEALIHHSDRGIQYCSAVYQNELRQNQIQSSMTDGADCYQNALAERVNGILKQEFLIYTCRNGAELEQLVKESIETYNSQRPHLSLGMKTPNSVHEKACGLISQAQFE